MKKILALILFISAGLLAAIFGMNRLYNEGRPALPPIIVKEPPTEGVYISTEQGNEITLTLAHASIQKVEKWIRTAGSADAETKLVRGRVYGEDAKLVQDGQKVRIFPLVRREPVLQGRVIRIVPDGEKVIVETDLQDILYKGTNLYVMEIIVDLGSHLTIPNEAIIEEAGLSLVYVQMKHNLYVPRIITTGVRGELYTQALHGLDAGNKVVTFGSFFIDAQYKLSLMNKPAGAYDSSASKEGQHAHLHH